MKEELRPICFCSFSHQVHVFLSLQVPSSVEESQDRDPASPSIGL